MTTPDTADISTSKTTINKFSEPRLIAWSKAGTLGAPIIYRDTEITGLCFIVRLKKASFAFESRLNQKTIRIVIGKHPEWSLGRARERARELRILFDKGIDPRLEKRKQKQAVEVEHQLIAAEKATEKLVALKASVLTREVWNAYVDAHKGDWGDRHHRDHVNLSGAGGEIKARGKGPTKAGVLAPVLAEPLSKLDAVFIKAWLVDESKARANSARQGFEALRAFWKWAAKHDDFKELISDSKLFEDADLLKLKPKRQAASAKDVLEKSHLADWFTAVKGISSREISAFLQCLLLLGCRRNELLGLKWEHIDTRTPANIWIHDKVDGDVGRYVPLGSYALSLMQGLPKREWTDASGKRHKVEWVFSSAEVENQRIHHDSAGAAHARALSKAGVGHVSVHGLRRSYSSLSEWLEIPAGVVAQIQGHKPSATAERHYKRRPLELLAQWHGKFELWILEQGGG